MHSIYFHNFKLEILNNINQVEIMINYRNSGGDSGVDSYEIGDDYITVKFTRTARTYTYSYASAGRTHVEQMKSLARSGSGLNSYINKYVRNLYE